MQTLELIVFGGIALIVGVMSLLHLMESMHIPWFEKRTPHFILIMLSLVVGALLLESNHTRHNEFEERRKQCERTEKLLAAYDRKYQDHILGGRYLSGVNEVYESGLELIRTAEHRIRVFMVIGGPRPPAGYFEEYAISLAEKMRNGTSVGIDVVYSIDAENTGENTTEDLIETIMSDRATYVKHGVIHLVSPYIVDMSKPYGFSILTVDRKHAQISFPPLVEVEALERTSKFVDQDRLVTDLVGWFDTQVVPSAIPLEKWLKDNKIGVDGAP